MKKIIFIIYTVVITVTGLCAIFLKEHLNVMIDSLIPAAVTVCNVGLGALIKNDIIYYRNGHFYSTKSSDFRYTKNNQGKGSFVPTDYYRKGPGKNVQSITGYTMMTVGAFSIPAVFFFPITVKWGSLGLILVGLIVGGAVAMITDMKETKAALEAQRAVEAQWKKELEEQKKREELGKWK